VKRDLLLRETKEVASPTSNIGALIRLTRLEVDLHDCILARAHLSLTLGNDSIERGVGSARTERVEPSHDYVPAWLEIGDCVGLSAFHRANPSNLAGGDFASIHPQVGIVRFIEDCPGDACQFGFRGGSRGSGGVRGWSPTAGRYGEEEERSHHRNADRWPVAHAVPSPQHLDPACRPSPRTASSFAQHPELARGSCPAARATVHSFSRIAASKSRPNFPHASRVSCSELLGSPRDIRAAVSLYTAAADGFQPLFANQRHHHEGGEWISPPPTEKGVQPKTAQENC
jgi:hypothetical protein